MTWNYRVIQFGKDECPYRAIHEVYYKDDGSLAGYSERGATVEWDIWDGAMNNKEAIRIMDMMKEALGKPLLLPGDFHE